YAEALTLYFDRHDGQACTIEDWLKVFEDTTGRDLAQFKRWYSQAGTPHLEVEESYDSGTFTLTFRQHTPPSTATPDPQPQVIPVAMGLLGPDGSEVMATQVLEITEAQQSFSFPGQDAKPVPSILRGFSAPVVLKHNVDHAFLLTHDTDPYTRWEAARDLGTQSLLMAITTGAAPKSAWLDGVAKVLSDETLDPAYRAYTLALPGQSQVANDLHNSGKTPDPDAIWVAHEAHRQALSDR
ncbi:MAG: DUF3458 domain-containing protein, partial [Pseudomonadota bacterium]